MKLQFLNLLVSLLVFTQVVNSKTYYIGPNRTYKSINAVTEMLGPGDTVYVDGNATYEVTEPSGPNGTIVVSKHGTFENPICIIGVTINGKKPLIKGANTTSANIIDVTGNHVVIDNLDIQGNINGGGNSSNFTPRGIRHRGDNLTVRRCIVRECVQGILSSDSDAGSLLVEFCEVYGHGTQQGHHNLYLTSNSARYPDAVVTVQFNYIHDAVAGTGLKTRARRNQVLYNVFENNFASCMDIFGADLLDANHRTQMQRIIPQFGEDLVREDADVIGNLFVINSEKSYHQIVRFGGDGGSGGSIRSGTSFGRVRVLNNTFVDFTAERFNGMKLGFGMGSFEMYNNLFFLPNHRDTTFFGIILANPYSDNNDVDQTTSSLRWLTPNPQYYGLNNFFQTGFTNNTTVLPTELRNGMITAADPGLSDPKLQGGDFYLKPNSILLNAGTTQTTHTWPDAILFSKYNDVKVYDNTFRDPILSANYLPVNVVKLQQLTEKSDPWAITVRRTETVPSIGAYPAK